MNPDVVSAIGRLRSAGVLTDGPATLFDRVARRQLVSLRFELRVLLYVGVLLLTSGVGGLVAAHHHEIGRLTIAGGIGLAAFACLACVIQTGLPFSWHAVESRHVAFEYVLLLGLLLLAADRANVEVQFGALGPDWPYHLLVVGALYLAAAYRWDSRTVLGLALTTLAAWRGISLGLVHGGSGLDEARLRADALVLGALYLAAAALSVRLGRKGHFEDVFANAGLLLLLGALVSGALEDRAMWTAGLVAWLALRLGRSLYFAQAVVAAYVGLLRLLFERPGNRSLAFLLAALLGAAGLVVVTAAHRRMRER
jgi:hypothetical protein